MPELDPRDQDVRDLVNAVLGRPTSKDVVVERPHERPGPVSLGELEAAEERTPAQLREAELEESGEVEERAEADAEAAEAPAAAQALEEEEHEAEADEAREALKRKRSRSKKAKAKDAEADEDS